MKVQKICVNCQFYKRIGKKTGIRYAGYCSDYEVPVENYDKDHHLVVGGVVYGPVAKTGSCDKWEEK